MIYRIRNVGEGVAIIRTRETFEAYDDMGEPLPSWFREDTLYVKVERPTDLFLVRSEEVGNSDPQSVFHLYYDKEHGDEFEELYGKPEITGERSKVFMVFSKKALSPPFTVEVEACYEGEADNQLLGFLAKKEFLLPSCHSRLLGGAGEYYARGYAVGFNRHYSENMVMVNPNGECKFLNLKAPSGCYNLSVFVGLDEIKVLLNGAVQTVAERPSGSGHIYFSGNTGLRSSRQRLKWLRAFRGNEVPKGKHVGFSRVKIMNFRGIGNGEVSDLGFCNVILGSNNAGKTALLEALYLLVDAKNPAPGFGSVLEFLRSLHDWSSPETTSPRFLYRFYINPFILESDDVRVYAKDDQLYKDVRNEDGEWKTTQSSEPGPDALFLSPRLIPRYATYLQDIWEQISNRTDLIDPIVDSLNDISNERYSTITLEPFSGYPTMYLLREDRKRVRLNDVGEGFQLFVIYKILLNYYSPSMILFDDIESHMNPMLISYLIKELTEWVERKRQIFVTTHNLSVARSLLEGCGGKGIILDLLEDGSLRAMSMSLYEMEKYEELGIDPRLVVKGEAN